MRGAVAVAAAALAVVAAHIALAGRLPSPGEGDAATVLQGVAGLVPILAAGAALAWALRGWRAIAVAGAAGLAGAGAGVALDLEALATPARLVTAAAIGAGIAALVATPPQLGILALVAGVVDAVSVAIGPTGYAADRAPELLRAIGLQLPGWGGPPDGLLGAVDVAMLVLFVAGARRTGLRAGATAVAGGAAVCGALVLAVVADMPLPAIPAISLAFVAVNPSVFHARTGGNPPVSD